jgi:hypothetical protein
MAKSSSYLRGPFRDLNDTKLDLGPCAFCGKRVNTDLISRIPCEKCRKVVCWECADCGVYGSLHDFQYFVNRDPTGGGKVFLLPESCPTCQETSWWEKYTSQPNNAQAKEIIEGNTSAPASQAKEFKKVLINPVNRYNLEEVKALRFEIVKIAKDILSGETGIAEGARLLCPLGHSLQEIESVPEFLIFDAVVSETDHLPVGIEGELWSKSVLQTKQEELSQVERRYTEKVFSVCKAIIEKCEEQS